MTIDLDELERLEREATPGPYVDVVVSLWVDFDGYNSCDTYGTYGDRDDQLDANNRYAKAAFFALPALIRIARAAKALEEGTKGVFVDAGGSKCVAVTSEDYHELLGALLEVK